MTIYDIFRKDSTLTYMNLPLATWEPKSERTFIEDGDLESLTVTTSMLFYKGVLIGVLIGSAVTATVLYLSR